MHIMNGRIFTFDQRADMVSGKDGMGVLEHGFVTLEGDKIKAVGTMDAFCGSGGDVLDVRGAWVFPGLIDAHCHVGISEEKWGSIGDDCNEATSPLTPYLRGLDAVNPMDSAFHDAIMAGITSVMTGPGSANIVGGQSVVMKVQGRDMERMILKAPAAMKIAFGENPKVNYGDKGSMPCSRMAIAGLLREELYQAKEYWEQKKRGQHVPNEFRKECWIPVLEGNIPLKAHVHRADDILTAIRIAKEFHLDMTLDQSDLGNY